MLTRIDQTSAILLVLIASLGGAATACGGGGDTSQTGAGGSGATGQGGSATSSSGTGGSGTMSSSSTGTSSSAGSTASTGSGGGGPSSKFPDSSSRIAVLADQIPNGMTPAQQQFVVDHFVGTQKLTLNLSDPLRALKPDFLVLHYHLAMWQSAPGVDFIVDGQTWSNDYPFVDQHESWFWHNPSAQRVASNSDAKLLMNVSDPDFQTYWIDSLKQQVQAGKYDGIFLDSASPALLQGEAQVPPDPRIQGTGVKDNPIPELGNKTFIQAWEEWITGLDAALAQSGIPLIPNTGAFVTTWDNTDYSLSAGIFSEGYASPSFPESDWKASTNYLLMLAQKGKIIILQNYLGSPGDLALRRYYLANYLLVKGDRTYIDYFASGPFEWYPEWTLDLGVAMTTGTTVNDLASGGVYRRDFEKGAVLVNPTDNAVMVSLGAAMQRVEPQGGGTIDAAGNEPGSIGTTMVTAINVPAKGAEILLK